MYTSTENRPSASLPTEWVPTTILGRHRGEYVLYRAQHIQSGQHAHLRVLNPDANDIARKRFIAELEIASKHPNHFLPVLSLQRIGDSLAAACDIPAGKLVLHDSNSDVLIVARMCQHLTEALQTIHDAGWVHGALCCEAVELVDVEKAQVRLIDMGMGLELGRTYSGLERPNLPPAARGIAKASPLWDVYSLGILGRQMTAQVECRSSQGCASTAMCALFSWCSAESPNDRPQSLSVVAACLRVIMRDYPSSDLRENELATCLSPFEGQWFVKDRITKSKAAEIDGYAPFVESPYLRFVTILLSVAAGVVVAALVATIITRVALWR